MIGGVNQSFADEIEEPRLNGGKLFGRDEASRDAALIGDNDGTETGPFEAVKAFRHAREEPDLPRIAAVIHVVHQGAVPIEEHSGGMNVDFSHVR